MVVLIVDVSGLGADEKKNETNSVAIKFNPN